MLGLSLKLPKVNTGPFNFGQPSQRGGSQPFDRWLSQVTPSYSWEWAHLRYIRTALDQVTTGAINRLMIFCPPQHGKSQQTTIRYPVWRLEHNPELRVIIGCYNQTLANRFSRQARRIAEGRIALDRERRAVEEWQTAAGGIFRAVGVGAGITGQSGDLICIDDPVKSREEAESQSYRDRCYDWYSQDLFTRQGPQAAIILIMCMTGDTPVLMADGTERPLRDIRVGDNVATYDNGKLATSTVRNHRSNGLDSVYRIKTTCGIIVYANERHPFLVEEHGQLKWIRLRDLTTAHRMLAVKDSGASGRAKHASLKAVRSLLEREDIVPHTTAKSGGPTDIARRQTIQSIGATYGSSNGMESPPRSMTRCSQHKTASVLFANNRQGRTCARIGAASYALTTATKRTPSGRFCATTVTSPWAMPRPKQPHWQWPNTSDFTTEQIESIDPAGVEEVFDIQIERTENFIANGLVSHNTRWHEADLAGRILASEDLCPARYDEAALAERRMVLGSYAFNALYQGHPSPPGGGMFQRDWFSIVNAAPADATRVRYWDKAGSENSGDYSAGVKLARDADGVFYIEDVVRGQWSALARERIMRQTAEMDGGNVSIGIEQEPGSGGKESAESSIRNLAGFAVSAEKVTGEKGVRAMPFAAQCEARNVKIVRGAWNGAYLDELCSFPYGAHDDQIDGSSGAFAKLVTTGSLLMFGGGE
jgi:predicted phage terminase large subunit-like protein